MAGIELVEWTSQPFTGSWTQAALRPYLDSDLDTAGLDDLLLYDSQNLTASLFKIRLNTANANIPVANPAVLFTSRFYQKVWNQFAALPAGPLGYNAAAGAGELDVIDAATGAFQPAEQFTDWAPKWTLMVAGEFGLANVLFYDASAGVVEFHRVYAGGMDLIQSNSGLPNTWTAIVPGMFHSQGNDDLFCYDQQAGTGDFYQCDANGVLTPLRRQEGLRTTWQQIVAGNFLVDNITENLLFYEADTGYTELYATDGAGGMSLLEASLGTAWSTSWQFITAGDCTPLVLGEVTVESICAYDAKNGVLTCFRPRPFIATVIILAGQWQGGGVVGPVITVAGVNLSIDMSAYNRPTAIGTILDSSTITVAFPDDATYTGTLARPAGSTGIHRIESIGEVGTINWSNGSSWTRPESQFVVKGFRATAP